tara:strand:- start:157 stop:504 length:348 start_codon:yes stop_codon:yes gene_type:complete
MKKIYHLATCSTCIRIIKELNPNSDVILQDIKTEKISEKQLDEMKNLAGSYENLFSKRAMKYKALGLKDKNLTESDYRQYILDEYTFLKRPVSLVNKEIFIGNSKKIIEESKVHF